MTLVRVNFLKFMIFIYHLKLEAFDKIYHFKLEAFDKI